MAGSGVHPESGDQSGLALVKAVDTGHGERRAGDGFGRFSVELDLLEEIHSHSPFSSVSTRPAP